MTIEFPNLSRSFDRIRNAVRFVGYDGMFEVNFFIDAPELANAGTGASLEDRSLSAFDASRSAIYDIARKAYSRGRHNSYKISAAHL